MTVRLHESWAGALRELPETGMGYQVLELKGLGFRPEYVIVANGQLALDVARGRFVVREGIEKSAEVRVEKTLRTDVREASFSVLSRPQAVAVKAISSARAGSGPASEAPVEQSGPEERFLRFSAFPNDIRILADGSVTAGTYVTTYDDGMAYVHTGTDAVRRYALPNPAPAIHRYHLRPPVTIAVQRGTVQPANGQPGGGAEVIFVNGAPAKTKYHQDQIPPA